MKLVEAAITQGHQALLMVSSIGSNHPERWSERDAPYQEAKAEADKFLMESGLDYTIVRPGGLTDDPGTGRVQVGEISEYGHGDARRRRRS